MVKTLALHNDIWKILEQVPDPEVPVISVVDLGVIRKINQLSSDKYEIIITPTYSGCPAMDMIAVNIKSAMQENGLEAVIKTELSPAWTTDWISEDGLKKLKAYGIAPPEKSNSKQAMIGLKEKRLECPQCNSTNTTLVSAFGSTACKALYKCEDCLEPFDYFKCY